MENFTSSYLNIRFFSLIILNLKHAYQNSHSKPVFLYTLISFVFLSTISIKISDTLLAMIFFEMLFFWEFFKGLERAHNNIYSTLKIEKSIFKQINPIIFHHAKKTSKIEIDNFEEIVNNSKEWANVLSMKKGQTEKPVFLIFLSIIIGIISGIIGNGATSIFATLGVEKIFLSIAMLILILAVPFFTGLFFSVVFDGKHDRAYELNLLSLRIAQTNKFQKPNQQIMSHN
ncbi:hypothetical protein [Aquitalea magnusonii]|uniref:hypothetical protein n=1 Tax=Aquitalea magnusonii TaxID=332411 RepID=UPI0011AE29E6|nr:hypothetical protein [Aquitalea magnusonii]